ncbi:MAG TPA: ribosome maturation factor RimP [Salinisphaeraceae bacterium]|nr:ribosome maturation factor RimP [Salinisphaeraceae bacterium]
MSQQVHDLIEPVIADLGYELWHLERVGPAAERVFRVYIDAARGITLEDCERVSHEISAVLEVAQAQGNRAADYGRLEVSSPGLDRPLVTAAHFQRFIGAQARVRMFAPVDGQRRFCGIIRNVANDKVELEVDGKIFSLAMSDMAKARLEPAFGAAT